MISPTAIPSVLSSTEGSAAAAPADNVDGNAADRGGQQPVAAAPVAPAASPAADGSRMPSDTAFTQQRIRAWQPVLDPRYVIAAFLMIGIVFIPTGIVVRNKSNGLVSLHTIYESHLKDGPAADVTGCEIGNNPNAMYLDGGRTCKIRMKVPDDAETMQPPVMVHYELYNFYQNYRKYVTSFDINQLFGLSMYEQKEHPCEPLTKIGNITINPCGLIANTLFNDVITLESIVGPDGEVIPNAPLVESGIAWESDLVWKYRQPVGFRSEQCPSCDLCDCDEVDDETGEATWSCKEPYVDADGNCFKYFYPDDDTTLYLYETYPMVVSPLDGVTNEHFVVWMRTAALSHFRKLYGYIEVPIPPGSVLTFEIMANYAVQRNEGAKALVVGNSYAFGGKNHWLGTLFVAGGVISATLGLMFLAKELTSPRKLGDRAYLRHKED